MTVSLQNSPSITLQDLTRLGMPPGFQDDPPRNEERVRIRCRIRPNATSLPGGIRLKKGKTRPDGTYQLGSHEVEPGIHEAVIYRSDLKVVKERVEPHPEDLERAREEYAAIKSRWFNDKLRDVPLHEHESRRPALERKWLLETDHPTSPEQIFTQRHARGVKPLIDLQVVEEGIEPPKTDQTRLVESLLKHAAPGIDAQALGTAIAQALAQELRPFLESRRSSNDGRK